MLVYKAYQSAIHVVLEYARCGVQVEPIYCGIDGYISWRIDERVEPLLQRCPDMRRTEKEEYRGHDHEHPINRIYSAIGFHVGHHCTYQRTVGIFSPRKRTNIQSKYMTQLQFINTIKRVRLSHSSSLYTCKYASYRGRYAEMIAQVAPYNTVSIHIPIIDILAMGGSAALVTILARTRTDTRGCQLANRLSVREYKYSKPNRAVSRWAPTAAVGVRVCDVMSLVLQLVADNYGLADLLLPVLSKTIYILTASANSCQELWQDP